MPFFEQKVLLLYTPKRIDLYLAEVFKGKFSRQEFKASLDRGNILVNGKVARPSFQLKAGDLIEGRLPYVQESSIAAEAIHLKIIYEDSDILVIDKPTGMVVHPCA